MKDGNIRRRTASWWGVTLALLVLAVSSASASNVLWTCPKGESIEYVRTGCTPSSLFVLTKKGNTWTLRTIGKDARSRTIARGTGHVQGINSIVPSANCERLLVGWRDGKKVAVTDCRYDAKPGMEIGRVGRAFTDGLMQSFSPGGKWLVLRGPETGYLEHTYTDGLQQPFSPDGKWLVLKGSVSAAKGTYCYWLVNRRKCTASRIDIPISRHGHRAEYDVSWLNDGRLAMFSRSTGKLYTRRGKHLSVAGSYSPGVIGYLTPDGRQLTIVKEDEKSLSIERYNTRSKAHKTIYRSTAPEISKADIREFQHAGYCGDMTLNLIWPKVNPVYIDAQGRCREVRVADGCWPLISGIAIWKPGVVAVAGSKSRTVLDTIVTVRVGK